MMYIFKQQKMQKPEQIQSIRNKLINKSKKLKQSALLTKNKLGEFEQQQSSAFKNNDFVIGYDSKLSKDYGSEIKFTKQLANKSIMMRRRQRQSKEKLYKKNVDLNLSDYLRLYSMSKKSSQKNLRTKSAQPKIVQIKQSKTKTKNAIDTGTSIKVVRQQTKKQIANTHTRLKNFLNLLDKTQHLKSDEQSLVFMCNVLHVFQQKIMKSVKYAQQLIDERKKQKNIQDLKDNSRVHSPTARRMNRLRQKFNSRSVLGNPNQFSLSIHSSFSPLKKTKN